jgi:hypothetical protein
MSSTSKTLVWTALFLSLLVFLYVVMFRPPAQERVAKPRSIEGRSHERLRSRQSNESIFEIPAQPDRYRHASFYPPAEYAGAIDPAVTQENISSTICIPGFTRTRRPSSSYIDRIKRERMIRHSMPGSISDYELDHVIPLELGGCPACPENLWMQSYSDAGARQKDRVERVLNQAVCNGDLSLVHAQKLIAEDWYAVYVRMGSGDEGR